MIKSLKKYQVQLTPFNATKEWSLNNTNNDAFLITEDGFGIALEFLDYGDGTDNINFPFDNAFCNISLEQQCSDLIMVEEGLKVLGSFYPDIDPKNEDNTYKRSIYYQIKTMFYNSYFDPSKVWGSENIDFQLSKTKRNLSDKFRLFNIPREVFGDKIVPKSVVSFDDTLDNDYIITDDGNGNLFAGTNIFSFQQEIGKFINEFNANDSSHACDSYWKDNVEIKFESANVSVGFYSGSIIDLVRHDTVNTSIGFIYGSIQNNPPSPENSNIYITFYSGSTNNIVEIVSITGSFSNSPTLTLVFNTGSIFNTTTVLTASNDSASINLNFNTGNILTTTFESTNNFNSASVNLTFDTGSILTTTFEQTMTFNQITTSVEFYHGSLM